MAQASEIKKQYKKRTLFQETWRRLTKNRGAMLGLAFLVLLVLAAALSPVIFDYEKDVIGQNMKDRLMGPCAAHWFGTDEYGRDLFARIIYGARYSLIIGVGSVVLGLLVGTILGSQAGFKGGITDSIIMLMRTLMLPLNAVPLHDSGKLFFFGLYPLAPLCISTTAALKPLLG